MANGSSKLRVAVGDQRGRERDHEAEGERDQRELDVLDHARPEPVAELVDEPVQAELAVLADALVPAPEVGDDRPVLREQAAITAAAASIEQL